MTVAIIIGVCVVLLILAFLLPRLSRYPQRGVDSTLGTGQRTAGKARARKSAPKSPGRAMRSCWWILKISVSAMVTLMSK